MNKVTKITNNTTAVHTGGNVYTVSLNPQQDLWSRNMSNYAHEWESSPLTVDGVEIVPLGACNDLPEQIRTVMEDNYIGPGNLQRKKGLLWGLGPRQYKTKFQGEYVIREYLEDPDITAWLKGFNFRRYVDMASVEVNHLSALNAKYYLNKGARIGQKPFIQSVQIEPQTTARLGWPKKGPKRLESVDTIYTGDFSGFLNTSNITAYPVFDPKDPFKHRVSMGYHNEYSFARAFYSIPSFYGTLKWLIRSSEIPDILKYLTDNGISAAYHIHSPQGYWEDKVDKIKLEFPEEDEAQWLKRLDKVKDDLFESISAALTGKENAGKFIETVDFVDPATGTVMSWKIEPIDQSIKEFIEGQLKVADKADSAATSGMGLHPSLANIIVPGNLTSGSMMLYALKLYLSSDTTIPEEIIFEPINLAIQANWPDKDIKIGFYRNVVMQEQNVSPDNRVVSATEQ